MIEGLRRARAVAFERIDAQIDRRPAGEGHSFRGALFAEHFCKPRVEPFRIVAAHMRRRVFEACRGQRLSFRGIERGRAMAGAVGKSRNGVGRQGAGEFQRAEQGCARGRGAHQKGRRTLSPQSVEDEAADRRAVAGTREAVGEAPVLQGIGGGAPARLDVGQHFDGRREPGPLGHGYVRFG